MDRKHIARYANGSILVLIAGWLLYTYAEMPRAGGAIIVIGFFGLAMYGGTLVRMSLYEPANIPPGTQDLPPIGDIEAALLDADGTGSFAALPHDLSVQVRTYICKATRITSTSAPRVTKKIKLRDKWGGEWELSAIRTKAGQAELCINRVYYGGKAVQKLLSLLQM